MHEYSIALSIVETVRTHAGKSNIRGVRLSVGTLSGVFTESLQMYLEIIFQEMQSRPVALAITKVPASFACSCGEKYEAEAFLDPCPRCGGYDRTVTGGADCTVESIEVDDE